MSYHFLQNELCDIFTLCMWVFNNNRSTAFGLSTATNTCLLGKVLGSVIDKMYVKEGLVFEKSTVAGYSDLEEVNNLFAAVEQHLKSLIHGSKDL